MVRQYPDKIVWWEGAETPGYDEDGNPIIQNPDDMVSINCRYENFMKGGNRVYYRNRNGEDVLATGTLFLKKGTPAPKRFQIVDLTAVRGDHTTELKLECLNVYHGQLNITIHVTENVGN